MGASWKTTIGGILAGGAIGAQALLEAYNSGLFTGKTGLQLVISIGTILLGLYAKDKNVTGGTIVNTTNDANVVANSSTTSVATGVPVQASTQSALSS